MRVFVSTFLVFLFVQINILPAFGEDQPGNIYTFEIIRFDVIGYTKLTPGEIETVLKAYVGPGKTAQDVEQARAALEKYYHQKGYPTALVNIPEQRVEGGSIQLQVIETKIRRVRVTGNRFFTMESILKQLPSFKPGEILYLPKIQEELAAVNSHPDLKVAPVLSPGKEVGTVDVELKVKDKLPLHGGLELNNRSTHETTNLRLNGLIRYDNLWQKGHSACLQYQLSPQDTKEVEALAASYILPAPWNENHILAIYGVWSDSYVAFGDEFQTVGKGFIVGLRDVVPLPAMENYTHNLTLGIDYKDFEDTVGFEDGDEDIYTPITYVPICANYNSTINHHDGVTRIGVGLNTVFRGFVSERKEFEDKRYKSTANYTFGTLNIERKQKLPGGWMLLAKGGGQITDQPLPSNEQYFAGGMKSVRGYKETEQAGDEAIYATLELCYPDLAGLLTLPDWIEISPNMFWDIAGLELEEPLSGQDEPRTMEGIGLGVRGKITPRFEYDLSWGVAQRATEKTERGTQELNFILKSMF